MIKICNKVIEYSFYALFLLVPLAFTSATSELFELNKMWLTWVITIIIAASWFTKMILQKKIIFQRTPLDIPIGLFLASQIISTIFSLDFHVSMWGYYSRFNGGLLSIISYILLYYAFVSNVVSENSIKMVKRLLFVSLVSGTLVALWGLPSHFGYDPTCLIFRGTFDVSCWTANFLPKIRIFSTLGQPDWLAAYLAILIPVSIAFFISKLKSNPSSSQRMNHESGIMNHVLSKRFIHNSLFIILASLFYLDLLYTRARSGFLAVWLSLIFFFIAYLWLQRKNLTRPAKPWRSRESLIIIAIFLFITFIIGTPIGQLNKFTLEGIGNYFQKTQTSKTPTTSTSPPTQSLTSGGTESANIRMNVWKGAIEIWKNNPLFGTGVETFAFAYYKYKPIAQNLTSEWNFLYNKAHNEYLNYLATTGIVGLGTYLGMIGFFLTIVILRAKPEGSKILRSGMHQTVRPSAQNDILIFALIASYLSILITNFFGFSVVITNIYLFMIPAFVFALTGMIKTESRIKNYESSNLYQWTSIFCIILTSLFMILTLFRFWQADIAYAMGYNLDWAGEYQKAYPYLQKAVLLRGSEPVFKDELSINEAIIAVGLIAVKGKDVPEETLASASSLAQNAIKISDEIILENKHNAVFWKTRTRLFYTLSEVNSDYLPKALEAIKYASILAPNDVNILYNLGILYGQSNNITEGIKTLEKTIKLKPDYRDARYALGLFYREEGLNEKALAQMQYILDYLNPNDSAVLDSLKSWEK